MDIHSDITFPLPDAGIIPDPLTETTQQDERLQKILTIIKSSPAGIKPMEGIIGVRPGYGQEKNQDQLIISVILAQHAGDVQVPNQIEGIQVEARRATVLEEVEGIAPLATWEDQLIEARPNIHYEPPPEDRVTLAEMEVANILCHVGPDAGWSTLKAFLEGTKKTLTIAMYEFYAEHILKVISTLGSNPELKLDIIIQVDKNDKDIEATLKKKWGKRLQLVKASVSGPNRLFNNSYHTKVAVRDSKSVWMSSGNWSPNSQPVLKADATDAYKFGNREWHVVIDDRKIAKMYEAFIRFDMEEATKVADMEMAPVMPDLLIPESLFFPEAELTQSQPFEPKSFGTAEKKIRIQPLMSPDNYAVQILKLIRSAKKSLYLQFSYVTLPATEVFDEIIETVSEKMQAGLDVKVILGSFQKPTNNDLLIAKRKWKRSMFKIQKSKLHNKGVIVDGKIAVVGSNNWSSDGTQYNRDTSIIFYSKPIAQYYTEVFNFDWDNLTRPVKTTTPEVVPLIAPESGPTPLGMVRVPWQAWFNE